MVCRSARGSRRGRVHKMLVRNGPVSPACRPDMAADRAYTVTRGEVTCKECKALR